MSKELWIDIVEEMVDEYMEHRGVDWNHAYEAVTNVNDTVMQDEIHARYREHIADMADAAKDRAKAEGNWPPAQGD